MVIQHLKQIEKVIKLDNWVPHDLTESQKSCHFEVSSYLILCNNSKPFLDQIVTCDETWIFYDNWRWPRSVVAPRRSSKAFAKAKLTPKKDHGHCFMVCWPSDPLQLSESKWNHCIWEVCSANQWDEPKTAMPASGIGQQKGPNSSPWQRPTTHRITDASKVEQSGLQSFASSTIFTWPLANRLPPLQASWQLFAGKMFPQAAGCRKCFPRVCRILKHATGINISFWQKCVDCNGSYFD